MSPNQQFPADLVTFTEKIINVKLHFLCSVSQQNLHLFGLQHCGRTVLIQKNHFQTKYLILRKSHYHTMVNRVLIKELVTNFSSVVESCCIFLILVFLEGGTRLHYADC